jgi:hypothetical protein
MGESLFQNCQPSTAAYSTHGMGMAWNINSNAQVQRTGTAYAKTQSVIKFQNFMAMACER